MGGARGGYRLLLLLVCKHSSGPSIAPIARYTYCLRKRSARIGTAISGSMRTSAGCRYSAAISLYSAHTGTIEGPLLYVPTPERCLGSERTVGG